MSTYTLLLMAAAIDFATGAILLAMGYQIVGIALLASGVVVGALANVFRSKK